VSLCFLESPRLVLRPLTRDDLTETYVQWLNDAQVCEFNSHAVFPYTAEQMAAYYQGLTAQPRAQVVLAIVAKNSGKHLGNISLQGIDWVSRCAEFAIMLGDKDCWGQGIGQEAGHLMVDYGFQRLNLHRIHCGTSAANQGMQKLATALKMTREGLRRQSLYKNGQYHDIVEYGLLRSEYYAQD
jgi:ribosomal-protein-alanine N-acetyltransferase